MSSEPVDQPSPSGPTLDPSFLDSRLTEQRNARTERIDVASSLEIVDLINSEDATVPLVVAGERERIARAIDLAVAAFGRDVRRLRPNILIGGVDGVAEFDWAGAELHVGGAVIGIDSRRGRCPMTTVDPDTLGRDPEVLRDIGRRFGGRLALNAELLVPGRIQVGDAVRLVWPAAAGESRPR